MRAISAHCGWWRRSARHVIVGAVVLAVACSPIPDTTPDGSEPRDAAPTDRTSTLVAAVSSLPDVLDPHHASVGWSLLAQVVDTLVVPDAELRMQPALATSWEQSDDGRTWEFVLRDDVYFHDGRRMTAEDVVYSLERVRGSEEHGWRLGAVTAVQAADEYTVTVSLSEVQPHLLERLGGIPALGIIPEGSTPVDGDRLVGTGPFVIDRSDVAVLPTVDAQAVTLGAFDEHFDGRPSIDNVHFAEVGDPEVLLALFESGAVDWIDAASGEQLADRVPPDSNVGQVPGVDVLYLAFNHQHAPFDERRKRHELANRIDRDLLIQDAFDGRATPARSAVTPASRWAVPVTAPQRSEVNGDLDQNGDELANTPIELLASADVPGALVVAEAVKAQLESAGYSVFVADEPLQEWIARRRNGDFTVLVSAWFGALHPFDFYDAQHRRDGSLNFHGINDAELEALLDDARDTKEFASARERYGAVAQRVVEEAAYIHLAHPHVSEIWGPRVEGYGPHPSGIPRFGGVTLADADATPAG